MCSSRPSAPACFEQPRVDESSRRACTPLSDAITGMRDRALDSAADARGTRRARAPASGSEASSRFGERLVVALDVEERVHLLAGDLFFVERAQHQQRGAGVLERPDDVEVVAERPGADDQRMRQAHSEIGGAEIHHFSFVRRAWRGSSSGGLRSPER